MGFKIFRGINEKSQRVIILNHKNKFLVFEKSSKLLQYLKNNDFSPKTMSRAINNINKIFRSREEEYKKAIIKKFMDQRVDYIG